MKSFKGLLLTGLLGFGLINSSATECSYGKLINPLSVCFYPIGVAAGIVSLVHIGRYFTQKDKIEKHDSVTAQFAPIKTSIDGLSIDVTPQAVSVLRQNMRNFELTQNSPATDFPGYAELCSKLNDVSAAYPLEQGQEKNLPADVQELRNLKSDRLKSLKEAANSFTTKHQENTLQLKKKKNEPLKISVLLGAWAAYFCWLANNINQYRIA